MTCKSLGETGKVAMTAALETVARRIIRKASEHAVANKRKMITRRFLRMAIESDSNDLRILFRNVRLAGVGVLPERKRRFRAMKKIKKKTKK